jgi:cholesterol transport system auxiliary component
MSLKQTVNNAVAGAALLLSLMLLSGCESLLMSGTRDEVSVYVLESAMPETKVSPNPAGPAITVSTPRAGPGFTGSQMLYVEQDHRLDAFAFHRWADTPANMLEPLLVQAVENSGLFSAVAPGATGVRSALRLDSEVLRLQQNFGASDSKVELALRFTLVDESAGRVVATRVMTFHETAGEKSPYGGVVAANRAVGRTLSALQAFLRREIAGIP